MKRLISRSELARLGKRSAAAVTMACRAGGALAPAVVEKRIDADHPATRRWLGIEDDDPSDGSESGETDANEPTAPNQLSAEELEEMAEILRPLLARFGTATVFKDWLDALKKIVDIREKDLKNDEFRGRLISRELVEAHVFGAIEGTFRKLLSDSTKTIARRVFASAKSGQTIQEAEAIVHDIVSTQLQQLKAKTEKALRNA